MMDSFRRGLMTLYNILDSSERYYGDQVHEMILNLIEEEQNG